MKKVKVAKKRGRHRLHKGHQSEFVGFYVPKYMGDRLRLEAADWDTSVSRILRMLICKAYKLEDCDAKKSKLAD